MKKYLIDNEEVNEQDFLNRLEQEIAEHCDLNYDDYLDESYGDFDIGYITFSASEILKNCDPVAYRCGLSDYVSDELSNAQYKLEHCDETTVECVTFTIEDDGE